MAGTKEIVALFDMFWIFVCGIHCVQAGASYDLDLLGQGLEIGNCCRCLLGGWTSCPVWLDRCVLMPKVALWCFACARCGLLADVPLSVVDYVPVSVFGSCGSLYSDGALDFRSVFLKI